MLRIEESSSHKKTIRNINLYDKGSKYGKKKRRPNQHKTAFKDNHLNEWKQNVNYAMLEEKYCLNILEEKEKY